MTISDPKGPFVTSFHRHMSDNGWARVGHRRHMEQIWQAAKDKFPDAQLFQIDLLLKDFFSSKKPQDLTEEGKKELTVDAIADAVKQFAQTYTLKTEPERKPYNGKRDLHGGPGGAVLSPRHNGRMPPGFY